MGYEDSDCPWSVARCGNTHSHLSLSCMFWWRSFVMNKELKLLNFGSTKREWQKRKRGKECTADTAFIAEKPKNITILEGAPSARLSGERTSWQSVQQWWNHAVCGLHVAHHGFRTHLRHYSEVTGSKRLHGEMFYTCNCTVGGGEAKWSANIGDKETGQPSEWRSYILQKRKPEILVMIAILMLLILNLK